MPGLTSPRRPTSRCRTGAGPRCRAIFRLTGTFQVGGIVLPYTVRNFPFPYCGENCLVQGLRIRIHQIGQFIVFCRSVIFFLEGRLWGRFLHTKHWIKEKKKGKCKKTNRRNFYTFEVSGQIFLTIPSLLFESLDRNHIRFKTHP